MTTSVNNENNFLRRSQDLRDFFYNIGRMHDYSPLFNEELITYLKNNSNPLLQELGTLTSAVHHFLLENADELVGANPDHLLRHDLERGCNPYEALCDLLKKVQITLEKNQLQGHRIETEIAAIIQGDEIYQEKVMELRKTVSLPPPPIAKINDPITILLNLINAVEYAARNNQLMLTSELIHASQNSAHYQAMLAMTAMTRQTTKMCQAFRAMLQSPSTPDVKNADVPDVRNTLIRYTAAHDLMMQGFTLPNKPTQSDKIKQSSNHFIKLLTVLVEKLSQLTAGFRHKKSKGLTSLSLVASGRKSKLNLEEFDADKVAESSAAPAA